MSNTYFLKSGNTFSATSESQLNLHNVLPAGNYVVKASMDRGFYLEEAEEFNIPSVIYGNIESRADRILNTFDSRSSSTGVLLIGEQGSGKTLLAKLISNLSAAKGIPTVLINQPFVGESFNTFISSIKQPCVVLFDEFDKVYDKKEQTHILTLLDGVFGGKKLFIVTANDKNKIDGHMKNRPGRFFYFLEFSGLDHAFVREYCQLTLTDSNKYTEPIVAISTLFYNFNFDMLQAMVEEVNRYQETPKDLLDLLNVKPDFSVSHTYSVEMFTDGVLIPIEELNTGKFWSGNPLNEDGFSLYYSPSKDNEDNKKDTYVEFTPSDILSFNAVDGIVKLENSHGFSLILTKKKERVFGAREILAAF